MVQLTQRKVLFFFFPSFSLFPKRRWFYHFIFFKSNSKPQNVSLRMLQVLLDLVWGRAESSSGGAGKEHPSGACSECVGGQSGRAQVGSWGRCPGLSEDTRERLFRMSGRKHRKYVSGWMSKGNMCPCNGILLSLKEWSSDPCHNMMNLKNSIMPGEGRQSQKIEIFFQLSEIPGIYR